MTGGEENRDSGLMREWFDATCWQWLQFRRSEIAEQ